MNSPRLSTEGADVAAPSLAASIGPARGVAILLLLAAAVLRLLVVRNEVSSLYSYRVDDRLYLDHAVDIAAGRWLGTYDQHTLAKSPGYGLFLAFSSATGLSRLAAEAWVSIAAGVLLYVACRRSRVAALPAAAAAALWMLASSHFTAQAARPLRDDFCASLTVLAVAAGALRLAVVRERRSSAFLLVVHGLALGYGAIVREEAVVFLAPHLPVLVAVWLARRGVGEGRSSRRLEQAGLVVMELALIAAPTLAVTAINRAVYGVACVSELSEPEFGRAIGAIQGVARQGGSRLEPLSKAKLERLYELSPTLARSAKSGLDGAAYRGIQSVDANGDRIANFTLWALRDAAAAGGRHRSAAGARAFYRQVADEIDGAVARGAIASSGNTGGILPPLERRHAAAIAERFGALALHTFRQRFPTIGAIESLELVDGIDAIAEIRYRRLLREPTSLTERMAPRPRWTLAQTLVPKARLAAQVLLVFAVFAVAVRAALCGPRFFAASAFAVYGPLLLVWAARLAMVAVLETIWFSSGTQYAMPFYPLAVMALLIAAAGGPANQRTMSVTNHM